MYFTSETTAISPPGDGPGGFAGKLSKYPLAALADSLAHFAAATTFSKLGILSSPISIVRCWCKIVLELLSNPAIAAANAFPASATRFNLSGSRSRLLLADGSAPDRNQFRVPQVSGTSFAVQAIRQNRLQLSSQFVASIVRQERPKKAAGIGAYRPDRETVFSADLAPVATAVTCAAHASSAARFSFAQSWRW